MNRYDRAELVSLCPRCGAEPGQTCRAPRGTTRSVHASRVEAAANALVLSPPRSRAGESIAVYADLRGSSFAIVQALGLRALNSDLPQPTSYAEVSRLAGLTRDTGMLRTMQLENKGIIRLDEDGVFRLVNGPSTLDELVHCLNSNTPYLPTQIPVLTHPNSCICPDQSPGKVSTGGEERTPDCAENGTGKYVGQVVCNPPSAAEKPSTLEDKPNRRKSCSNCGKPGHYAKTCEEPARPRVGARKKIHHLQKKGPRCEECEDMPWRREMPLCPGCLKPPGAEVIEIASPVGSALGDVDGL